MVMKKTMKHVRSDHPPMFARKTRRLGVAEAKARLSRVLRSLEEGPVVIHNRGRDLGALVDIESYERLTASGPHADAPTGGEAFLRAVEALKLRHGGGVEDFQVPPADLEPLDPFAARRRR
jgi:prevent-host-death family protein